MIEGTKSVLGSKGKTLAFLALVTSAVIFLSATTAVAGQVTVSYSGDKVVGEVGENASYTVTITNGSDNTITAVTGTSGFENVKVEIVENKVIPGNSEKGITTHFISDSPCTFSGEVKFYMKASSSSSGTGGVIVAGSSVPVDGKFVADRSYSVSTYVYPDNAGKVTVRPEKSGYSKGEEVTVCAEATDNWYEFHRWMGDVPSDVADRENITLTVDGDLDLTANFSEITRMTEEGKIVDLSNRTTTWMYGTHALVKDNETLAALKSEEVSLSQYVGEQVTVNGKVVHHGLDSGPPLLYVLTVDTGGGGGGIFIPPWFFNEVKDKSSETGSPVLMLGSMMNGKFYSFVDRDQKVVEQGKEVSFAINSPKNIDRVVLDTGEKEINVPCNEKEDDLYYGTVDTSDLEPGSYVLGGVSDGAIVTTSSFEVSGSGSGGWGVPWMAVATVLALSVTFVFALDYPYLRIIFVLLVLVVGLYYFTGVL